MKLFAKYLWVVLLYISIYSFCVYSIAQYEFTFDPSLGSIYSFATFTPLQKALWIMYKYLLNFPLSFFNWFGHENLYLTAYFLVPNAIASTIILVKLKWIKVKTINYTE